MRAILREKNDEIENLETMVRANRPHLLRDWAHPRSHPSRDWAHPGHICTGTGLTPATSAPGPGLASAHIRAGAGPALGCHIRAA